MTHGTDDRRPGDEPGSVAPPSCLDLADYHVCLFAVSEQLRAGRGGSQHWRTRDRLNAAIAHGVAYATADHPPPNTIDGMELVGSGAAARLIGRSVRYVQRNRDVLGARLLPSGRLVFDVAVLRRHLHETTPHPADERGRRER